MTWLFNPKGQKNLRLMLMNKSSDEKYGTHGIQWDSWEWILVQLKPKARKYHI